MLDALETLCSGSSNQAALRTELVRLFRWLKKWGVTTVITAERGEGTLTRQGLEEYVSDCVILLDNRVIDQITTRRLRIVKYRGSTHGTNEYPYIITEDDLSVLPVTSLQLDYPVSDEIILTGVPGPNGMFERGGWCRGSTTLVPGSAGTAKTTLAPSFAAASCQRGDQVLYFAFKESPRQLVRNMQAVGIGLQPHLGAGCPRRARFCASEYLALQPHLGAGCLPVEAAHPTLNGLERHLVTIHKCIAECRPQTVVVVPASNLSSINSQMEVRSMLRCLVNYLKVNAILTSSLTSQRSLQQEMTAEGWPR